MYLPCKNPHCQSVGHPHPNCRCYGDMAEGGEAHFCASARPHQMGCEYFAEGGEIDPGQVEIDPTPEPVASPSPTSSPTPEIGPDVDPAQIANTAPIDPNMVEVDEPIDPELVEVDSGKPKMPGEDNSVLAAIEGGIKGLFGETIGNTILGMAPVIVGNEMVTPEAREARAQANPIASEGAKAATLVGSLLTGTGEAGLIEKAAESAAKYADLGRVGSGVLKGAMAGGLFQADDEVSKWMLGQGDPEHPVGAALANIGTTAWLTGTLGGVGGAAGATAAKLADSKMSGLMTSFLSGIGAAAQHAPEAEVSAGLRSRELTDLAMKDFFESALAPKGSSYKAYELGQKAFDKSASTAVDLISKPIAAAVGNTLNGVPGALAGLSIVGGLMKPVTAVVDKYATPAMRKFVAPVTLKILSSGNTEGLLDALRFAAEAGKGEMAATKGIGAMMEGLPGKLTPAAKKSNREKIRKWIDDGGVDQEVQQELYNQAGADAVPGFAHGGEVPKTEVAKSETPGIQHNKGLALHYPDQAMRLSMARGRISNYLTSLKPHNAGPAKPFDDKPDLTEKKRTYDRALDIAAEPLSILEEIGKGTLEAEHLKHFNSMVPELGSLLKKKATEHIVKAQIKGEKPPYKVRQALSLFLGTNLSSDLSPESIQAAQQVFAQKAQPTQAPQKPQKAKGNKSALTNTDKSYLTGAQAIERRQQKM